MPLKSVYAKAPLVEMNALPLCPGQVRTEDHHIEAVYDLLMQEMSLAAAWAPAFRLSCALTDEPEKQKPYAVIMNAIAAQREDGSLPFAMEEAVGIACAAWAVYTWKPEFALLERLMNWCRWCSRNWEQVMAADSVRRSPADLMELLTGLYRLTGRKGLLTLCESLRHDGMDWSGALHTFAVSKPFRRVMSAAELDQGMAEEKAANDRAESGFYTHQYLTCHGETLADGARTCLASSVFSGNRQETDAARIGWERISRRHGAVCGGVTADETLAGMAPDAAIDAAALGAWTEAFAAQIGRKNGEWAAEQLELLTENGLRAAINEEGPVLFQCVNELHNNEGTANCFRVHPDKEQKSRAVIRLARAWAAVLASSVQTTPVGADILVLTTGEYKLRLKDTGAMLTVSCGENDVKLTVKVKSPVKAALKLRIPAWMDKAAVKAAGTEVTVSDGYAVMNHEWHSGDEIVVSFEKKLQAVEGYHQSVSVRWGRQVMVMPAETAKHMAAVAAPSVIDGKAVLEAASVSGWTNDDIPVLPKADGEPCKITLVPYAETPCRISVFPKGVRA